MKQTSRVRFVVYADNPMRDMVAIPVLAISRKVKVMGSWLTAES
jgi:hypothetical protein